MITQNIDASQIAFGNMVGDAIGQLEAAGLDKRRIWPLREQFDDLLADTAFWVHQARSLCVLATPDHTVTFRLANRLAPTVQVSDRFHLTPLLRTLTHFQTGYVLALSENGARLIDFFADMAPSELRVPDMPSDAASAVGKASINDRSHSSRIVGSEGKKVRLRQYARAVDAGLRPVLAAETAPLILVANPPLGPIFRSVASYPHLLADSFEDEVDRMTPASWSQKPGRWWTPPMPSNSPRRRRSSPKREGQGRATADIATAAPAAAFGAIEMLLVDMDAAMPGAVDADTGAITFAEKQSAYSYGIVDQIAIMALATGAEVLSVRAADLPHSAAPLAASLRYRF